MFSLAAEGWHVVHQQERFGPVTLDQLRDALSAGRLNPEHDLAWVEGMGEWKSLWQIDGLVPKAEVPAPAIPSLGTIPVAAHQPIGPPPKPEPEPAAPVEPTTRSVGEKLALFALPALALGGAICWTVCWFIHDVLIYLLLPEGGIPVPIVVLLLVYGGIGMGVGKLLGIFFRMAGFHKFGGGMLVCGLLVAAAAIAGELFLAVGVVAISDEALTLGNILAFFTEPFTEMLDILGALMHYTYKVLLAIGVVVGTNSMIDPEQSGHLD